MNTKKIKVENDDGEIIRIFDTIKEAAAFYGVQPEGMTYRAKHRICKNGETVSFLEQHQAGVGRKRRKNYNGVFKFDEKNIAKCITN